MHVLATCVNAGSVRCGNARTGIYNSNTCSGSCEKCSRTERRVQRRAVNRSRFPKFNTQFQALDITNESKEAYSPIGSVCCVAGKETRTKKLDHPRSQKFYGVVGYIACTWRAQEYDVDLGSEGSDKKNILWTEHSTLVIKWH